MNDSTKGLYDKYRVIRKYENPKHKNCRYFVLDVTHDPYAIRAISAYADSCRDNFPELAKDLDVLVEESGYEF